MEKAVSIKVTGRLQNVGYRHYARLAAQDYKLTGKFVVNDDGSVYIEAQGEQNNLEEFIEYCKRGPAWARVDSIDIEPIPCSEERISFEF